MVKVHESRFRLLSGHESLTEDHYRGFMQDWEARLNHDLRHGVARRDA